MFKKVITASAICLATVCSISNVSAAPDVTTLDFPMTVWGSLTSSGVTVNSWATVSFYNGSWANIGSLTTVKNWFYGGDTAYDSNIAILKYSGNLGLKVSSGGKEYVVTPSMLSTAESGCPVNSAITFTSKICRYDINLQDANIYTPPQVVVSSGGGGGGGGGGWSVWGSSVTSSPVGQNGNTSNAQSGTSTKQEIISKPGDVKSTYGKSVKVNIKPTVSKSGVKTFSLKNTKKITLSNTETKNSIILDKGTVIKLDKKTTWNQLIFAPIVNNKSGLLTVTISESSTVKDNIKFNKPVSIQLNVGKNSKFIYNNKVIKADKSGFITIKVTNSSPIILKSKK